MVEIAPATKRRQRTNRGRAVRQPGKILVEASAEILISLRSGSADAFVNQASSSRPWVEGRARARSAAPREERASANGRERPCADGRQVGAAVAHPGRQVIAFAGDGGFFAAGLEVLGAA